MPWKTAEHKRLAIKEVERAGGSGEVGRKAIRFRCAMYWAGTAVGWVPGARINESDAMREITIATGLTAMMNEATAVVIANDGRGWESAVEVLRSIPVEGE